MDKLIFKLALTVCLATTVPAFAVAADLTTGTDGQFVDPKFDPVNSSSIWNGAYAGLYGGLNWKSVGVMGSGDIDLNSQKEVGGYVGINQELGNSLVGGIEWMGGYSGDSQTNGGVKAEQDWETSLRARMGYAFEQNLVYGLAGVSATQLELSSAAGNDSRWLTGYTVGAGVERQFTDSIVGRVEYDYTDYGAKKFDIGPGSTKADITGHGLKLGVGVKF